MAGSGPSLWMRYGRLCFPPDSPSDHICVRGVQKDRDERTVRPPDGEMGARTGVLGERSARNRGVEGSISSGHCSRIEAGERTRGGGSRRLSQTLQEAGQTPAAPLLALPLLRLSLAVPCEHVLQPGLLLRARLWSVVATRRRRRRRGGSGRRGALDRGRDWEGWVRGRRRSCVQGRWAGRGLRGRARRLGGCRARDTRPGDRAAASRAVASPRKGGRGAGAGRSERQVLGVAAGETRSAEGARDGRRSAAAIALAVALALAALFADDAGAAVVGDEGEAAPGAVCAQEGGRGRVEEPRAGGVDGGEGWGDGLEEGGERELELRGGGARRLHRTRRASCNECAFPSSCETWSGDAKRKDEWQLPLAPVALRTIRRTSHIWE